MIRRVRSDVTHIILLVIRIPRECREVKGVEFDRFASWSEGFCDDKCDCIVGERCIARARIHTESGRWISFDIIRGRFERSHVMVVVNRKRSAREKRSDAFPLREREKTENSEAGHGGGMGHVRMGIHSRYVDQIAAANSRKVS